MRFYRAAIFLLLFVRAAPTLAAQDRIPPAPTRFVTDTVGFMSPAAARALDQRLEAYDKQTGHQLLVWIGSTLDGVPIEDFAVRAFEAWKPGRQKIDDGLILFIFAQDRQLRFEVGYGLEGDVPDALAGRIINEVIRPLLQANRNDEAVAQGMDAVIRAIGGEQAIPGRANEDEDEGPVWPKLIFQIVIGLVLLFLFITNPSLAIYILANIFASSGRMGGGRRGGGFGGGGFSGGGGRSGGGGASGSW